MLVYVFNIFTITSKLKILFFFSVLCYNHKFTNRRKKDKNTLFYNCKLHLQKAKYENNLIRVSVNPKELVVLLHLHSSCCSNKNVNK